MRSARARTIARLRTLAAAGVATAACHGSGYGVVDPMPMPSCFDSPQPTATAAFVPRAAAAGEAPGTRYIEIVVSYSQTDVKVGACSAVDESTGASLDVVERAPSVNGFRCVVRAPKELTDLLVNAPTECRAGAGRIVLVAKVTDDAVTVEVR